MTLVAVALLLVIITGATGIGTFAERAVDRVMGDGDEADVTSSAPIRVLTFRAVLGTVIYLWAVLLLKCLHLSWPFAAILPALVGFVALPELLSVARRIRFDLTPGFALWLSTVTVLGLPIMDLADGVGTAWRNNYGDLAWHVGIITSFTFGENFPPQYHIYPGKWLTYPFFGALLNAATFWVDGSFYSLSVTSLIVWVLVWCVVWVMLDGNRRPLGPFAVLFAGGTFPFVVHILFGRGIFGQQVTYAHDLIERGWPWVPFITTMWIPQRGTWLGLAVCTAALARYHVFLRTSSARELVLGGLLLGISPLVHGHLVFATIAYVGLSVAFGFVRAVRGHLDVERQEAGEVGRRFAEVVTFAAVAALPCIVLSAWWIGDKVHGMELQAGWMRWYAAQPPRAPAVIGSTLMWLANAPIWLLALSLLAVYRETRSSLMSIAAVFLLSSVVKLAPWEWDQLKLFAGLYIASIFLLNELNLPRVRAVLLVLLMIPAIVEVARVGVFYERYVVYSKPDLKLAAAVRGATKPGDIIAARPDHNSPVTASGRLLYIGYAGTIGTHGINGTARLRVNSDLERIVRCTKEPPALETLVPELADGACADYILWTERERRYWNHTVPGPGFREVLPQELYRVEE